MIKGIYNVIYMYYTVSIDIVVKWRSSLHIFRLKINPDKWEGEFYVYTIYL